ncbi:Stk1 family PASTA domain-containing Ser/Thr kinase [Fuchsiella alkaliacetigena]|uniref:Stk1 family PASTA domain-containing Ser/Thr kinase n=1 Tax=Fuchsiella alkaliacetigena TaxID=957042 RepID=UPI00200B9049|nr:Stk1 family PASTA domain-containing Ser/Thr kinase [Fuchsiella alkaliacetigena]MCK8823613.1 Stk1 family PASTA domain-containing Ser/Thr kinase [Fuchsiella alkaliacetigena]
MIGNILNNRYQLKTKLGEGGMALVFAAHDKLLNREVAVKVLRSQYANDKVFVKRFRREAQSVATFSHPNIVNIFDIGKDQGTYYIVMEKVEGETLKHRIAENSLEISTALSIAKQIAQALVVAHRNDIIHCDIKPANILLTAEGGTKLTDFGIAKALNSSTLTHTETVLGSANYFAPEQAKGDIVDARTDIYSLGIVLYEMVTGEIPFEGDTPVSVALKHIKESPRSPKEINSELPASIEDIIMKAIRKDRAQRYSSVKEMLADIDKALEEQEEFSALAEEEPEEELERTIVADKKEFSGHLLSELEAEEEIEEEEAEIEENSQSSQAGEELSEEDIEELLASEEEASDDGPGFVKRNIRWLAMVMVLLLLTGGGFLGYRRLIDFLEVPVVEVPELMEKELEAAERKLESLNLGFTVHNEAYHQEIPEGNIISQEPQAGREVRENREVSVVVSQGPRLTKAPDIIGKSMREARIILDEAELNIGETEAVAHERIPEGEIISQSPEPEAEIAIDSSIDLIVSKGEEVEPVDVPSLIGLNEEEAKQVLRDLDLVVGSVSYEDSLDVQEGEVLEQEPSSGTEVSVGSEIDLVVSDGVRNVHDSEVHDFRVRVSVNPGPEEQEVEIIVEDDNGRRVVYNEIHNPGDLINEELVSVGSTVVQVYINDNLVREQTF